MKPRILATGWDTYLLMLVIAMTHRLATFSALAGPVRLFSRNGFDAWLVGTLSDVWVSYLGALVVVIVALAGKMLGQPALGPWCQRLLLLGFALACALHTTYVDYFHIQMIPFHLRYITDAEFLAANARSVITWQVGCSLAVLPIAWFLLSRSGLIQQRSNTALKMAALLLTLAAGLAHNRNIHFREQWFIADNLQVNAVERLYRHFATSRLPPAPGTAQLDAVAEAVGSDKPPVTAPLAARLFGLITKPAGTTPASPFAMALHSAFKADRQDKQKPLILVVLMESLRPSETGYFAPEAGPSLTPRLDALAKAGVVFTRAYSTGSVTRGAQEATFCGYLGSRSTSLMRGEASARMTCLPDMIATTNGQNPDGRDGTVVWLHGGDPRFDGQVEFWRSHGVEEFMSLTDFPAEAPRNGWGIGDQAFFRAAGAKLKALRDSASASYLLAMALSVSNHIPWALPADAGAESHQPRTAGHPSYATTAYADSALGGLIDALHQAGMWDHTLLILASDHGTLVPPLVDLYQGQKHPDILLASHINLVLSGGLTSRALALQGHTQLRFEHQVSQADIAPLIADVIGLPGRFMGEDPFLEHRHLPVLSDLEQDLFDHGSGRSFAAKDLAQGGAQSNTGLGPIERKALLYYQSFLQYIYQPH